jgi:hypothetical protein
MSYQYASRRIAFPLLFTVLLAAPSLAMGGDLLARAEKGPVRVIVNLNVATRAERDLGGPAGVQLQRQTIASAQDALVGEVLPLGAAVTGRLRTVPALALKVNEAGLRQLLRSPRVRSVVEDSLSRPLLTETIPIIDGDIARTLGYDGTGRMVGILDTGVEAGHSFFGGRVTHEACFSTTDVEFASTTLCPNAGESQTGAGAASATACSGLFGCDHGTHVAGIAAGDGETFDGVAPGASILAIQVFSSVDSDFDCGFGFAPCLLSWESDQMQALDYVYDNRTTLFPNVDALNLSLGGGGYTTDTACDSDNPGYKGLIDNLKAVGVATAIAAGNGYSDTSITFPGCISSAVTVGATNNTDAVAAYSNSAYWLDLWAPGSGVKSSVTAGLFGKKNGTSMATPHVAGALSVLRDASADATVDELLEALQAMGKKVSAPRVTTERIDVDGAIAHLVSLVSNGSFEVDVEPDTVPDGWTAVGFSTGDKRACNKAAVGSCSMRFMGGGGTSSLTQTLEIGGAAGEAYTLYFKVKAANLPTAGAFKVMATLNYVDLTKKNFSVTLPSGTYSFKDFQKAITAEKDYSSLTLKITFPKATGQAWVENVVLAPAPSL